jgi:hypothetical protein
MTAKIFEYLVEAGLFVEPPAIGQFFTSQSGGTTFHVTKVRRVSSSEKPAWRLIGMRLRRADVPDGAVIHPWPRRQPGRPRASEPPRAPAAIVTRAAAAQAERRRVLALRRSLGDPSLQQVDPVRVASGSAVASEWRDPDDINPNRRIARTIRGFRAADPVDVLFNLVTFNRAQAAAAKRFQKLYELGEIGLKPAPNMLGAGTGFAPGVGPSESRLIWLEAYQQVCAALRRSNVAVLLAVIIRGDKLADFARVRNLSRPLVSGMLLAAVQFLIDFWEEADNKRKRVEQAVAAR